MHLYAFGSICRGEVVADSDIDLLALTEEKDDRFDPKKYSIYSYGRMQAMWLEGNPFSWHLALEARPLYASDGVDFLKSLGQPSIYQNCLLDCEKFYDVFRDARCSLSETDTSSIFDLSTVFLCIRNIATCYALGVLKNPDFSRHSALHLDGGLSVPVSPACYRILERSRILCTRSQGAGLSKDEMASALSTFEDIDTWMSRLVKKARDHERI